MTAPPVCVRRTLEEVVESVRVQILKSRELVESSRDLLKRTRGQRIDPSIGVAAFLGPHPTMACIGVAQHKGHSL